MPFQSLGTRDADPEPKLLEPEPFPVAGIGTGGIFYPEPESQREPICSPDPGPVQMCKIFLMAGLKTRSRTFFLELELEPLGRPFWLGPELVMEPL